MMLIVRDLANSLVEIRSISFAVSGEKTTMLLRFGNNKELWKPKNRP
jgi:hypothetical protein